MHPGINVHTKKFRTKFEVMLTRFRPYNRGYVTIVDGRNRKFFFCELMHDRLFGDSSADVCIRYYVFAIFRLGCRTSHQNFKACASDARNG